MSIATWQDASGRKWSINLTLELADHVLALTQVDLLPDDNDYREVIALCIRPRKLAAVLWECSRKAAELQSITRESFSEALDSDALAKGWEAIQKAIETFSEGQRPMAAQIVKQTFATQMRGIEAGVTAMVETMKSDSMDEALREAVADIDQELRRNLKSGMKQGMREALAAQ
jgi:hypothetical protein